MTNRHDRRAQEKQRRTALGKLKLRCMGCDRVGRQMTKEHFFPRWLIERANGRAEPIRWYHDRQIDPNRATLPLCLACNNDFGTQLEGPVSVIFEALEAGEGITDKDAELLVRWLWKFEGLSWSAENFTHPELRYSDRWTLKERVLGPSLRGMRDRLVLAVARINRNDEGFESWPLGIDSGIADHNGIFVSGVFCRTAMMVSLTNFAHLVPPPFAIYQLQQEPDDTGRKLFFPPIAFPFGVDAIDITKRASAGLGRAHEEFAREAVERARIISAPPRVELP